MPSDAENENFTPSEVHRLQTQRDWAIDAASLMSRRMDEADEELEQLRRVVECAKDLDQAKECANFAPGGTHNCYVEPPEGWSITLEPCLFCALATLGSSQGDG